MFSLKIKNILIGVTIGVIIAALLIGCSNLILGNLNTAVATQVNSDYSWSRANYQGMGFVTGVYFHPNEENLIYSRTDVGGAYRWNQTTKSWVSLSDMTPLEDKDSYGVESFGLDSNPQNTYMVTGSYEGTNPAQIDGKLWKSNNKGDTWNKIKILDSAGNPVRVSGNSQKYRGGGERLAIVQNNSQIMYYGSRYDGLLKSVNGGTSWSNLVLPAIPTNGSGVAWVIIDPTNPQNLYIAIADQGIYKSTTGGTSWSKLDGLNARGYPYRAQLVNQDLFVSFTDISSAKSGGLFKYSQNQWTEISPLVGTATTGFAVDTTNPQRIYADALDLNDSNNQYDKTLYQSINGGASWSKVNRTFTFPVWYDNRSPRKNQYDSTQAIGATDFYLSTVNLDPFNNKRLWFATGWAVFGTDDISQSQSQFFTIMKGLEELVINQVVKVPGGKLLAPTWDMGMIVSNDEKSLPLLQVGTSDYINNLTNVDYAESDKQVYVAVGSDQNWGNVKGQVLKSVDGGLTWAEMTRPSGAFGGNIAIDSANAQNMVWLAKLGIGNDSWNGEAYRTTNGGVSWLPISTIPQGNMLQISSTEGLSLVSDRKQAGTFYTFQCSPSTSWSPNFYRSTDGGATFTQMNQNSDGTPCVGIVNLKVNPEKAGQLWFSSINGGDETSRILKVSPDGGTTWTTISSITDVHHFGFGKAKVGNLPENTTIFAIGRVNGVYGMYMSDNATVAPNQAIWQNISGVKTFSNSTAVTGDMEVYGKVYVGTGGKGVIVGESNNSIASSSSSQNSSSILNSNTSSSSSTTTSSSAVNSDDCFI